MSKINKDKLPINLAKSYEGAKYKVVHCDGAIETFYEAMNHVEKHKQSSYIRSLIHQIKRLANGQPMSKENFPKEGELPLKAGEKTKKHFNALKRKPLRGYCWRSDIHENTYYISHYVHKDYKKLKSQDQVLVGKNWKKIEEPTNESD